MLLLQHMARRRRAVISGEASSEAHQQRHVRYHSFHTFPLQKKKRFSRDLGQTMSTKNKVVRIVHLKKKKMSSLNIQRPKAIRTMHSDDFLMKTNCLSYQTISEIMIRFFNKMCLEYKLHRLWCRSRMYLVSITFFILSLKKKMCSVGKAATSVDDPDQQVTRASVGYVFLKYSPNSRWDLHVECLCKT